MNWNDLKYFVTLVRQQTLTACAEHLNVQHSTVARRIEQLEHALDVKLFDRIGKRYLLTQEGERLFTQAEKVEDEIITFQRLAIDQHLLQGRVVVSAPPALANELIMPALPSFHAQYPHILLDMQGKIEISDLHRKEADIAIRLQRPKLDDLVVRTIGQVKYGFFAHKDYLSNTASEQWQLIEFESNSQVKRWIQQLKKDEGYTPAFTSNDMYMIKHALTQKVGIAPLPYFLANTDPNLIAIDPINRQPLSTSQTNGTPQTPNTNAMTYCYPLYLVMHSDVRRSRRVRAVADWLVQVMEKATPKNIS